MTLAAQELREYDRRLRRDAAELQTERGTADPDRHVKLDEQAQNIAGGAAPASSPTSWPTASRPPSPSRIYAETPGELEDTLLDRLGMGRRAGRQLYDSAQRRAAARRAPASTRRDRRHRRGVVLADVGQAQPPTWPRPRVSTPPSKAATPRPRRTLQQQRRRNRG